MTEGYLDQRLIGQRFKLKRADLTDGVMFYGIFYHIHAATPLHVGDLVEIVQTNAHGLTVAVVTPH
ncbi:hypothetical protein RA086_01455 [Lactiplantibacillus sp. WILCCON 0030]|uniref:Uncharacterized protein n=1 Tax=Lactiplantibacillus brownii TaxID=3069269 RepID=A0ABU1A7A3_9LACO|nr:hypothetical protein [Lactiplantibacillus brownii]MDQ7936318.1 hypothetical protein [Lactiplantibacillus brownii]